MKNETIETTGMKIAQLMWPHAILVGALVGRSTGSKAGDKHSAMLYGSLDGSNCSFEVMDEGATKLEAFRKVVRKCLRTTTGAARAEIEQLAAAAERE